MWPHVGKAKVCLGGGSFFQFLKKISAVCLQFFKKTTTSQTHFDFTNMGSQMLNFRVMTIWNKKFDLGHPVRHCKSINHHSLEIKKFAFPEKSFDKINSFESLGSSVVKLLPSRKKCKSNFQQLPHCDHVIGQWICFVLSSIN